MRRERLVAILSLVGPLVVKFRIKTIKQILYL